MAHFKRFPLNDLYEMRLLLPAMISFNECDVIVNYIVPCFCVIRVVYECLFSIEEPIHFWNANKPLLLLLLLLLLLSFKTAPDTVEFPI